MQLFRDDGRMTEVAAATAVLFRNGHAQQTFAAGLQPGLAIDAAGFVPLSLTRQALAFEETSRSFTQHLVILAIDITFDFHRTLLID